MLPDVAAIDDPHREHAPGRQPLRHRIQFIRGTHRILLAGKHEIAFDEPLDLLFHRDQTLPQHPNGMRFTALDAAGSVLHREEIFSTGGGFIVRAGDFGKPDAGGPQVDVPHPFTSGHELLETARSCGLELHELMLENERAFRPDGETRAALLNLWSIMDGCIR